MMEDEKIDELRGLIYGRYPSKAALARELGWPRQRLGAVTNGDREPDIKEVVQLARHFDMGIETMAQFFLSD